MGSKLTGAHNNLKRVSLLNQISGGAAMDEAATAARRAAGIEESFQKQAEDYLRQQNQLPMEIRDAALKGLAGEYGLPGFASTLNLTSKAQQSPEYAAMAAQIDQALQDQSNQAGATASQRGLLGSGVLNDALAKYRARSGVDKASALSGVYQQLLGGITGLTNQQSLAPEIAALRAQQGATRGAGITGQAETNVGAQQTRFNALPTFISSFFGGGLMSGMGGKSLGGGGGGGGGSSGSSGGGMSFSDIRLKDNARFEFDSGGHRWYSWTWNADAARLGLSGDGFGVMAHEVAEYAPHAVGEHHGYMTVNYDALGGR